MGQVLYHKIKTAITVKRAKCCEVGGTGCYGSTQQRHLNQNARREGEERLSLRKLCLGGDVRRGSLKARVSFGGKSGDFCRLAPLIPSCKHILTRHPLVTDTSYWTGFKLNGLSLPVLPVLLCQQKPRQYCFPKFP